MTLPHCRWGILGTANIANKNWQAILDSGNSSLIAVASRDAARSTRFISQCQTHVPHPQPPQALGSYEELIQHPDIDALYIPLPTGLRKEWVIRAAEAGKHVLVEKPVGISAVDVEEMIAACRCHDVQFMDGVMFMHGGRLSRMRELLDDDLNIGRIRHLTAQFSFAGGEDFMQQNIRTHSELEPFGCLGDLGWYCIRFFLWAMNYQMPERVTGRIISGISQSDLAPVPTEFSGELLFADNVSASFHNSFIAQHAQWVIISGTTGYVHIPDFVLPYAGARSGYSVTRSQFVVNGCQFDMHERRSDDRTAEPSNNAPGSQEANMFRHFSNLVIEKKRDDSWPEITLKTQKVMDACLASARQGSMSMAP